VKRFQSGGVAWEMVWFVHILFLSLLPSFNLPPILFEKKQTTTTTKQPEDGEQGCDRDEGESKGE